MFFVGKIADWKKREFFAFHWPPTLIVLIAFLAVTLWSWQQAEERAQKDRQTTLATAMDEMKGTLSGRVNNYEEVMRAGAGLFKSSEEVTREEWSNFAKLFDLQNRYPGIYRIAYVEVVPADQVALHETKVQGTENALRKYKIYPEGTRDVFTSILYSEPGDGSKVDFASVGYDPYSDPTRREAMETAIQTGEPALTDKTYPAEDGNTNNPSFAAYFPIIKSSQENETANDISEVSGFIQVLILNKVLFDGLVPQEQQNNLGYRVYSEKSGETEPFFQTPNFATIKETEGSHSQKSNFDFQNANWTIEAVSDQQVGNPAIQNRPRDILVGGLLVSIFVSSFVYILLFSRTKALKLREESELQAAKDELLALASHQLRTPATGVKQYVGMLLEGYAGKLSPNQIELLEKANSSNERQLTTINEMLSVARADTGRLPIELKRTNLNNIVGDVIDEQRKGIEQKKQKVTLKLPKNPCYANVDPKYFRMAIENVVNNASKYTPRQGAIDVRLKTEKNSVSISINDTGVGIPERHYPMLFKKFSRIPNELSDQVSGTGIGLYLAKYIVEAHHGKLTFTSDPGVGSSFKIYLPNKKKRGVQ